MAAAVDPKVWGQRKPTVRPAPIAAFSSLLRVKARNRVERDLALDAETVEDSQAVNGKTECPSVIAYAVVSRNPGARDKHDFLGADQKDEHCQIVVDRRLGASAIDDEVRVHLRIAAPSPSIPRGSVDGDGLPL